MAVEQNGRTPRSKEWILTALLQLMEHSVYSDISIIQIADKAGVVRQTFYRNYKDKDEVLFEYVTGLFEQFFELYAPERASAAGQMGRLGLEPRLPNPQMEGSPSPRVPEDFSEDGLHSERLFIRLFEKWKERLPSALVSNIASKDRKVRQILYRSLDHCLDRMIMRTEGGEAGDGPEEMRYFARVSLSSVIHVMLMDWTIGGFRIAAKEMGTMCFQLTASMRGELGAQSDKMNSQNER